MMATEQPNVLLVLADDIGWFDIGAYHRGIMGARRPTSTGSPPRAPC
jgi:arylsulfatase